MIAECLNQLNEFIEEQNRLQLKEGFRSDGSLIGTYADSTIKRKQAKGIVLEHNNIILRDTGDFWNSIVSKATGNSWIIEAKDWKANKLIGEWGEKIIGYPDAKKEELSTKLVELLKPKVNNFLHGM